MITDAFVKYLDTVVQYLYTTYSCLIRDIADNEDVIPYGMLVAL